MDIFANYATDENLENNGTWFDLDSTSKVLVARSGNRSYAKLITKLVDEARKTLDLGNEVADAKSDEIMIQVMAETILLGWEGLSFKGESLDYNVDNAKKLLAIRDFRKVIAGFADDTQAYKLKLEAEQGKV